MVQDLVDKKTNMYKWTVRKSIHHTDCCPAAYTHTHGYDNFVLFVGCLLFSLYSVLTANVKLNINQRYVTLLKTIARLLLNQYTHDGKQQHSDVIL